MKLLSIIALSGDKSAALAAAQDEVRANAMQVILHGNRRNFGDTAEALRAEGGVTKSGNYAANTRGDVLAALIQAEAAALSAQASIRPVMKSKVTIAESAMAETAAQAISDAFGDAITTAHENRVASRKAKSLARKSAKAEAPKAEAPKAEAPKAEAAAPVQATPKADSEDPAKLRAMVSALTDERDALLAERDALRAELDALRAATLPAKPKRKPKPAPVEALAA